MSIYEERVASESPDFYEEIKNLVDSMPTFHFRGRGRYGKVQQDNWKIVYEELYTLGRESDDVLQNVEFEADRRFMNALMENNVVGMKVPYYKMKEYFRYFMETYPALFWLLSNISDSMNKVYVGADLIDKIKDINRKDVEEVIPFIQSEEAARILALKDPNVYIQPYMYGHYVHRNYGEIFYLLEVNGADLDDMGVILDTRHIGIILSYLRKMKRLDAHIINIMKEIIRRGDDKTFHAVYHEFPPKHEESLLLFAAESSDDDIFRFLLERYEGDDLEEIVYRIIKNNRADNLRVILEMFPERFDYGSMIVNYAQSEWEEEELLRILYERE